MHYDLASYSRYPIEVWQTQLNVCSFYAITVARDPILSEHTSHDH